MTLIKRHISIFEEARVFHLKVWETPSFLFLVLGVFTFFIIFITYFISSKSDDPTIVIASIAAAAVVTLFIGGLMVKGLSKIIIIDKAKSEFISLASHQLRTPLSGIKWSLNLILSGELGHFPEEIKKLLLTGYESNERMIILVDDLLNVSRIEQDRFTYELVPTRLEKVVDEMIKDFDHLLKEKSIELKFLKPRASLPEVYIDKGKIRFVLQNLFDNAIKYSQSNGDITVRLTPHRGGKFIRFSVKDDGIGIPLYQQERIFSKFFRGDNAIMKDIPGSGLGLYIAKSIVERHGGKIWFESEENLGTTFYFTTPVYNEEK
jgi:signal transduction histidine kinase